MSASTPGADAATSFLNVDLDLRDEHGLDDLLRHLGDDVFVLHQTAQEASLELSGEHESLESCVRGWIALVQALPDEARRLWNRCDDRKLNVGIQAGVEPHAEYFSMSREAVSLLASVQFEIVLTIYAPSVPKP
jgi:hypothetical protein